MYNEKFDNKYLNQLIGEAVEGYKTLDYKYLDEVKTLVFNYLIKGYDYKIFSEKLNSLNLIHFKRMDQIETKGIKNIKEKTKQMRTKEIDKYGIKGEYQISEEELDKLKFKLDKRNKTKARQAFDKTIKRYYRTTNNTLKKEYIDKDAHLSQNVTKYDKVEKVIPYHSHKNGQIVAYHDIATYNSMIYNVNLLNTAWNSTYDACQEMGEDIIYVEPHPYACENCQQWQGKFYSISGKSKIYPNIQKAIDGGLKHPNCKHVLTTYYGQEETGDYSSEHWVERYKDFQKYNALVLKRNRMKTDFDIYKELNNQEQVDKLEQKLLNLNTEINNQRRKLKVKPQEVSM